MVNMVSSRFASLLFAYMWLNSDEKCCAQRLQDTDDEQASNGRNSRLRTLRRGQRRILAWYVFLSLVSFVLTEVEGIEEGICIGEVLVECKDVRRWGEVGGT